MEIINFQDKRWLIKYKCKDEGISPDKLEWYKWYKGAELVLKKEGILFFAEEIPEINFEEI
jgi:hypothetical protein